MCLGGSWIEDLDDHDDSQRSVLAACWQGDPPVRRRNEQDAEPLAGKSTLNRWKWGAVSGSLSQDHPRFERRRFCVDIFWLLTEGSVRIGELALPTSYEWRQTASFPWLLRGSVTFRWYIVCGSHLVCDVCAGHACILGAVGD